MTQEERIVIEKKNDSSTKVNYPQSVFSGIRKTKGFKCDTGLYEEFKRVARARMGSVCRPLECFMVAFLALNREAVNFGSTVRIENLHIERNLRSRRRLVVEEEIVETIKESRCFCGKIPVMGRFRHLTSGIERNVCGYHAKQLRKRLDWTAVEETR